MRNIEAHVLGADGYDLALCAAGSDAISPPPFGRLALVPVSLWPEAPSAPSS